MHWHESHYESTNCLSVYTITRQQCTLNQESDTWGLLDIGESLTGELKDVRGRSYKDEEQLRELVSGEASFVGHQPLPHNQQHQQGLMQRQNPVIGAHWWQELLIFPETLQEHQQGSQGM